MRSCHRGEVEGVGTRMLTGELFGGEEAAEDVSSLEPIPNILGRADGLLKSLLTARRSQEQLMRLVASLFPLWLLK